MKQEEEKSCGRCCWFYCEQTDGQGFCIQQKGEVDDTMFCSDCCSEVFDGDEKFVSREQMRHYQAVLLQANRYRRDQHVPPLYRMPDPKELGKAIDFAVKYIKVFSNL